MIKTSSIKQQATHLALITGLALSVNLSQGATWQLDFSENPDGPGSRLNVRENGELLAAWSYGEGQFKPYLHAFGSEGVRLTNSGLDKDGKKAGTFGHHRGIYIGWNRIESELGRRDLWHMKGTQMEVNQFTQLVTTSEHAVTEAHIVWRAGLSSSLAEDLLIDEHRTISFSRPNGTDTQIDFSTRLKAARDLNLNGDLQHAGVHFRAENEVANRRSETAYVWSPDLEANNRGMKSSEWQWATLIFPIGDRWFRCTEMTAPSNGFSELSWRDYGRFGFFDKKELKKDETLELRFRFVISEITDADPSQSMDSLKETIRNENQKAYQEFLADLQ